MDYEIKTVLDSLGLISERYSDVQPTKQDDGPRPVCSIAYPREYRSLMSLFRTFYVDEEYSCRSFDVTTEILAQNPAHYTVWRFRQAAHRSLNKSIVQELKWAQGLVEDNLKNYQLWHHRALLVERLKEMSESEREGWTLQNELDIIEKLLAIDEKNYHAWSYRIRLITLFDYFDMPGERVFIERLLESDVRNNSVWNYRYFYMARHTDRLDAELEFAKDAIRLVVKNDSPWAYMRGILRKMGKDIRQARGFLEELEEVKSPTDSPQYWQALLEVAELDKEKPMMRKALHRLSKVDRLRERYYRAKALSIESDSHPIEGDSGSLHLDTSSDPCSNE